MKKVIITIAITAILGTPSSSMAWSWGWAPAKNLFSSTPTQKENKPTTPQHYLEIIELLKQQLKQTQETHQSITKNRELGVKQADHTSFFLKKPELIYDEDKVSDISASIKDIFLKENAPTSVRESRDTITKRIQYATSADKAVSLKTFQDAEDRFKQLLELLEKINKTTDLKSIADLQAHITGMVALIQNETAKLQMVNYSHNAERAFISQQKKTHSMKILSSENKEMPIIRSIR
ncbi:MULTISPECIES: type IV secretion system protein [unclassified Bartonella]|uniref:type IV secretion system protein n=1 Tax=unclassified Bartonella TaxID=2645622 RepID=UPI00236306C8|nr:MULTISPECIES: type IV secretion system protein [unclassified Bartonella]